jgi:hypothetical protein
MAAWRISPTGRSYIALGLMLGGYAFLDWMNTGKLDPYYIYIGGVIACVGAFSRKVARLAQGRLAENEVVQMTLGLAVGAYAVYEWMRHHVIDYYLVPLMAVFAGLALSSILKRRRHSQAGKHHSPPADIETIWARASAGDAQSQYRLAYIYASGTHGLPRNAAEACFWYQLAARNGYGGGKAVHDVAAELTAEQRAAVDTRVAAWAPGGAPPAP